MSRPKSRVTRLEGIGTQLMEGSVQRALRSSRRFHADRGSVMDDPLWPLIHDCFAIARGECAPSGLTDDEVEAQALREVNTVYKV